VKIKIRWKLSKIVVLKTKNSVITIENLRAKTLKKTYVNVITSIWLFRLFLKRKVFLLWPIERCKRGLSVRNSPELSSVGLFGLSWPVTVSPGETVDDHTYRVYRLIHEFYSTIRLLMLLFRSVWFKIVLGVRRKYFTIAFRAWCNMACISLV